MTTPPTAATMGRVATLGSDSAPSCISRRISSPTTRKKMLMSPSLTQKCRSRAGRNCAAPRPSFRCHNASYALAQGEFAHARAMAAAASSTTPLIASTLMKRSGESAACAGACGGNPKDFQLLSVGEKKSRWTCRFSPVSLVVHTYNLTANLTDEGDRHASHGDREGEQGVGIRRVAEPGDSHRDGQVQRRAGEGRCDAGGRGAALEREGRAGQVRRRPERRDGWPVHRDQGADRGLLAVAGEVHCGGGRVDPALPVPEGQRRD